MVIPCSTESKRKISSLLFKTKLSLLNAVFRTNNDHKICFIAVYLMTYCITVYWRGKKANWFLQTLEIFHSYTTPSRQWAVVRF